MDNLELRDYLRNNDFFSYAKGALQVLESDKSNETKSMIAWLHYLIGFEENYYSLTARDIISFTYRLDGIRRTYREDLDTPVECMALIIDNLLYDKL